MNPWWHVPNSAWAGALAGQHHPARPGQSAAGALARASTTGPASTGPNDLGSLGTAASHGCVRMAIPDVIDLYDRVDVGTPIYIGN